MSAMDKAVSEMTIERDVATRKYKFMLRGLYVKYMYQRIVCKKTMPPRIPVTGRRVLLKSLELSGLPTRVDK